jgi:hypothetical protein
MSQQAQAVVQAQQKTVAGHPQGVPLQVNQKNPNNLKKHQASDMCTMD